MRANQRAVLFDVFVRCPDAIGVGPAARFAHPVLWCLEQLKTTARSATARPIRPFRRRYGIKQAAKTAISQLRGASHLFHFAALKREKTACLSRMSSWRDYQAGSRNQAAAQADRRRTRRRGGLPRGASRRSRPRGSGAPSARISASPSKGRRTSDATDDHSTGAP